jgi:CRP-like cAMP-binding protein
MLNSDNSRPANHLLSLLPEAEYQRLLPHLQPVSFSTQQILWDVDEPVDYVFFPHEAVVSLLSLMEDGSSIEIGTIGREGAIGMPMILSNGVSYWQAMIQIAGTGVKLEADQFKAEFDRGETLQKLSLRYMQSFLVHVSQSVACNRLHRLEERLARWILTIQDRVQSDRLPLTQEFIAQMLGTRRSGVNEAATALQQAGIIRYSRGKITVLDGKRLEAASCECYARTKRGYEQLLNDSYANFL